MPPITPDTGWVQDCQKTINNKIRGEHYDAQKVLFHYDGMTLSELSETKNKLVGKGEYVKSDGYWLSFDYQCVYDAVTASVEARAIINPRPMPSKRRGHRCRTPGARSTTGRADATSTTAAAR
ncbi:MAG: hypothetical protein R3B51_13180 [Thermodesulfobacteriota bacterium]